MWKRYAVALLSAGLGLGSRLLLTPIVGNEVPFITMFPAVVLSGWYGGFRAGMLTTLVGGSSVAWFFLRYDFTPVGGPVEKVTSLVVFLLMGVLISWLTNERNVAIAHLRKAHESERVARRRAEELSTREEALRSQAESANRAKDGFLAMLGHELRNPLAPMVTALELIRMRSGGALGRPEQVIERQVHHLGRMVDDLLDVSRVARGLISLAKRSTELEPIITRALEMASPLLEKRRHHVTVTVPRTGLAVYADPDRLAQVFANLFTNAAKYTDPGGVVEVSAERRGGTIVATVRDTGVGMSPELLARVFEPFVQGAQSIERSAGGLGIGLTLVKSLVSLHGGEVSAHSDGAGHGSTIEVRLPGLDRASLPAIEEVNGPAAALPAHRVLVVDDNEDAATLLADVIRAQGWPVAVAFDGPQALSMLESFAPDIAVLDIGLPVMDGYELAARIRERLGTRAPRLLAVTGYGQEEDRKHASEAGFAHHLVKPVSTDALLAAMNEMR
ncbi:response regulator [Polyangium jinanense]|uniref:histidine kinase n=1 Tax=Polyangium jinanense TaxID=2829994 RepID=A0A9X3XGC0_9BACT|nr:response regulator [Polyangium jinanense]MDC3988588.1 response regulator [Polyangium jinanense]